MKRNKFYIVFLCILAVFGLSACVKPNDNTQVADIVILNTVVFVSDEPNADGSYTTASAVAIAGDKIVYVGDDKGAERYVGESTEKFDAESRGAVLPGGFEMFTDVVPVIFDTIKNTTDGAIEPTKDVIQVNYEQYIDQLLPSALSHGNTSIFIDKLPVSNAQIILNTFTAYGADLTSHVYGAFALYPSMGDRTNILVDDCMALAISGKTSNININGFNFIEEKDPYDFTTSPAVIWNTSVLTTTLQKISAAHQKVFASLSDQTISMVSQPAITAFDPTMSVYKFHQAMGDLDKVGTIQVGKLADLAFYSLSIEDTTTPATIRKKEASVIYNGKIVYRNGQMVHEAVRPQ